MFVYTVYQGRLGVMVLEATKYNLYIVILEVRMPAEDSQNKITEHSTMEKGIFI